MKKLEESLKEAKALLEGKRRVATRETVWDNPDGSRTTQKDMNVEEDY
jgi:hypothetical protein